MTYLPRTRPNYPMLTCRRRADVVDHRRPKKEKRLPTVDGHGKKSLYLSFALEIPSVVRMSFQPAPNSMADANGLAPHWATDYIAQQKLARASRDWRDFVQPSVIAACLAVAGRVLVGPLVLVLLLLATKYFSSGSVLIKAEDSFFAFTEQDVAMTGGCSGCIGLCKVVLLKYALFNGSAFVSSPIFNAFVALGPDESLYDFSSLSPEALELGDLLDANGAVCQSGTNEWGATHNVATGTAQQILDIIRTLGLSVAPQMVRELELSVGRTDGCDTRWSMLSLTRLFKFPTRVGDPNFGKLSAVDISIFPDYTECRPVVPINDSLVGAKLALLTDGEDPLRVVPDSLKLFPYSFSSSLPTVSREVPAGATKYPATTVMQPLLRAYYSGCRVREVNTTGIFVEDSCELSTHWASYGLMVHSPDDIPLCSRGDVCVHNYFNSLWEWLNYVAEDQPDRAGMVVNTFRSRYADRVAISVLPRMVVMQILLMGIISFFQVMWHERSVLLTQIWAYRCQNGAAQVVYLAEITYHLVYNSDLYLLGLGTGTLTTESVVNLTCCFFAFSYSFVNLVKARTGDQQLDRRFRLTWEAMQPVIIAGVGTMLRSLQREPLQLILSKNAEILRKYSARGAKYCGLQDSCILFKVNMPSIVVLLSIVLALFATVISYADRKRALKMRTRIMSSFQLTLSSRRSLASRHSLIWPLGQRLTRVEAIGPACAKQEGPSLLSANLTSFERNCIGGTFDKLFHDCNDIAYVTYNGKRCISAEALLLTGYVYYGEHVYHSSSVVLLMLARVIPKRVIRTFNVLLLRWPLDPRDDTLSPANSCTWYHASKESHNLHGDIPVA